MARLSVNKTYKLFIGGKFPRTESGRYYPLKNKQGKLLANVCLSSRKDFRNAVLAARKAQPAWESTGATLKGQIFYRIAEMLEGRREQMIEELRLAGSPPKGAEKEVEATIDLLVYYAGWTDKYSQIFSSVNPVGSPHFNFSRPEATGVIVLLADAGSGLLSLAGGLAPLLCGGNTVVALASKESPLAAITFGEVLNTSDVPPGVANILTGDEEELLPHMSTHMDVNGVAAYAPSPATWKTIQENAALNIRRVNQYDGVAEDPYRILDFTEIKTTWHPVGS